LFPIAGWPQGSLDSTLIEGAKKGKPFSSLDDE
jgi:hypothetical protein